MNLTQARRASDRKLIAEGLQDLQAEKEAALEEDRANTAWLMQFEDPEVSFYDMMSPYDDDIDDYEEKVNEDSFYDDDCYDDFSDPYYPW